MKKILQINSFLNVGSTGRIAEEMGVIAVENGWDSYIAYGRRFKGESKSKVLKIGNKLDIYIHLIWTRLFDRHGFASSQATKKLVTQIRDINPDIIVLHNIHGYYINIEILFDFLRDFNKPIFWILYDCWAITGHCAYFDLLKCDKWQTGCHNCPCKSSYPKSFVCKTSENFEDKRNAFGGINKLNLIVHSEWLKGNIERSFLKDYPIKLIRNGINLEKFFYRKDNSLRIKYGIEDKFIILGIANVWEERKGFKDFILLSQYLKDDEIIVMDGLSSKQEKILPKNIISIGRAASVDELANLYSTANVFFNPTYEDNFPTTNLESLACGTPVVTYDTGGSPEALDDKTGFVCSKGNIDEVYSKMKIIKESGEKSYISECVTRAKNLFNYKERYFDCMSFFEKHL
ncbi:glycosyltransferase [Pedobacter steynii]